ncbi:MAG: aminopeptidase N [Pseudobdellovibrionaceae bacterium]
MTAQKIFLKDYKPSKFIVLNVDLFFSILPQYTQVICKTSYARWPDSADSNVKNQKKDIEAIVAESTDLVLDGVDLKPIAVEILDSQSQLSKKSIPGQDYQLYEEHLTLFAPPQEFILQIETHLEPQKNKSLQGLYQSKEIICTQCEAEGFRNITYFLDRPDIMAPYTVTIEADKTLYPVLLSNGSRSSYKNLDNNRHQVQWVDPHKKPCYLFALVAGDLAVLNDTFTTASGRKVQLEIYTAHGQSHLCHHAMASLKKAMLWDQETYNLEYDLDNYMIVAIDDFNAGAMENKGLNIFNSKLVLADHLTATDEDLKAVESVIAHEYFHNWTGNRVTLRDWFQLSLKEGLTVFRDQEFSADMLDAGLQRIEDVSGLRASQFAEDAGPNAHPVRPESCLSVDNFFTATIYSKGAELIRMMQIIVGKKGFKKGMAKYIQLYDGSAVTTEDFSAAIASANGVDFSQFNLWYSQKGTPKVEITDNYDASTKTYSLNLKQSGASQPFHIPLQIGFLDPNGQELHLQHASLQKNSDGDSILHLQEFFKEISFNNVECKPLLSILRQFSAPVILDFQRSDQDLLALMQKDTDSFNRWESAQTLHEKNILAIYQGLPLTQDSAWIHCFGELLEDTKINPGLRALLLQNPSPHLLAQKISPLHGPRLLQSIHQWLHILAQKNKSSILSTYLQCQQQLKNFSEHSYDSKAMQWRSLKNTCLKLLSYVTNPDWDLIRAQFSNSTNMTDQQAAFEVLCYNESPYRDGAIKEFHHRWQSNDLVLNKWLAVQAGSIHSHTLQNVKALTGHKDFNYLNPNKIYALLRNFGANLSQIYNPESLDAVTFYIEQIQHIDLINPQVAARLCAAFNFIRQLEASHQTKIKDLLRSLLKEQRLSKNVQELLQTLL